jgi:hypothetical protein
VSKQTFQLSLFLKSLKLNVGIVSQVHWQMFVQAGNERAVKRRRSVGIKIETSEGPIATQIQKHIVGFIYLFIYIFIYLYVVSLTGAVSNDRMTGE